MRKSDYTYKLITTRDGLVPIEEIKEGTEVLSLGEWKPAPKPIMGTCLRCEFDTLPTTIFNKEDVNFKREVSISHTIKLNEGENKPELAIRGYFKEDCKNAMTVIKGLDSLNYWLPKFIEFYNEPMMPFITAIGFNLYHQVKKFGPLRTEEITERNLEYILEGMNRRTFTYSSNKYGIMPSSSWNETHRLTLRLLDIECNVSKNGDTIVHNPIQFYKHIKDDYTKSLIKDEDIVYNLKRSTELPPYTNEHKILKKTEVQDWILPGINPDINTINPKNCYESGFTKMPLINPTATTKEYYDSRWNVMVKRSCGNYIENNFYAILTGKISSI